MTEYRLGKRKLAEAELCMMHAIWKSQMTLETISSMLSILKDGS